MLYSDKNGVTIKDDLAEVNCVRERSSGLVKNRILVELMLVGYINYLESKVDFTGNTLTASIAGATSDDQWEKGDCGFDLNYIKTAIKDKERKWYDNPKPP